MGVLDKVPFLAGYNEQDQMNRAQENQGLMKLSQLMQMQNQQKTMQMQDIEQQKKLRQEQALGEWAASQKDPQVQAMVRAMGPAALPYIMEKMKPQEPLVVSEGATAIDRKTGLPLFTNPKTEKLPWYVNRSEDGKTTIDAAYKDFEAMKANHGGTKVSVAAPVTPVTIQDPNNPNATIVIDGRTRQVLGAGPKMSQAGATQQKLVTALPQARLRTESISQNLDKLDEAMTALHDNPDLSNITGTVMGRTWNMTNAATGAQTDLNSIKSQIFQTSLQAMREASKTGGAVGNVSDKEGDKLERTLAGLDQSAGTPKFKENLKKAIEQVRTSKILIQNAFDEQYGGIDNPTPATPAPASQAKPSMEEFMSKARAVNPGVSGAELQQFYYKKYGGMK